MTRRLLLFTLAPAAGLAALGTTAAAASGALLINESPSLPEGLYRRINKAPTLGDVVALEPPRPARAYLSGLGMPPSVKLLKRVAASEGDTVCAAHDEVRAAGRVLIAHANDRSGAPLPRWSGCRSLRTGEIFVAGDSRDSFDSRYFGPVREAAVTGVYQEVLTW